MDDSTSTTLSSASRSMNEKAAADEAEQQSTRDVTRSPTPTPPAQNEKEEVPQLQRTNSTAEQAAAAELAKIMTSEEGREYPTGIKLGTLF